MNYLLNLNFYPDQITLGPGLARKRLYWTVCSYLLLILGILARQCIPLASSPLSFSVKNIKLAVVFASVVLATALFPPFTRWFNRRIKTPSWPHVLWAFSFGFFIDLSTKALAGLVR